MPDAGRPNSSSIPYLQVMTGGGASGSKHADVLDLGDGHRLRFDGKWVRA